MSSNLAMVCEQRSHLQCVGSLVEVSLDEQLVLHALARSQIERHESISLGVQQHHGHDVTTAGAEQWGHQGRTSAHQVASHLHCGHACALVKMARVHFPVTVFRSYVRTHLYLGMIKKNIVKKAWHSSQTYLNTPEKQALRQIFCFVLFQCLPSYDALLSDNVFQIFEQNVEQTLKKLNCGTYVTCS